MRPTKDQWLMGIALLTSKRATCLRRQVGCALVNERGHVIATGYNGVASGLLHCNERVVVKPGPEPDQLPMDLITHPYACPGARSQSGSNLDGCQAIHAEQNALLQCRDVYSIHTCYTTASPCMTCVKLLLNTSCSRVVFLEEYPHPEAKALWVSAGRHWHRGEAPKDVRPESPEPCVCCEVSENQIKELESKVQELEAQIARSKS